MKIKLSLLLLLLSCFSYALPFTHYTSDYLRLRKSENLDSEIITVLEPNLGIEVVEKGKNETIDGIKADWVKVKCANGYIGWCFSGYLHPIEKDVVSTLAKEVAKIDSGAYPINYYNRPKFRNITSRKEIIGKEGYYIQQQKRRFQGKGRAPEILQLSVVKRKVYVKEIDIVNNQVITLKETVFAFDGNTFSHDKSTLKLDEKNQLHIFYLENIPENKWSLTYEYEEPYTKVPDLNFKQLVNQTSEVIKNYAGLYTYDSFKIIKSENTDLNSERIEKKNLRVNYNEKKKCLSIDAFDLNDSDVPGKWTLDFIETSAAEPFYWTYGEGAGFAEDKFWFYKGGIAISYEYSHSNFDENHNFTGVEYIKYVVFLKKTE